MNNETNWNAVLNEEQEIAVGCIQQSKSRQFFALKRIGVHIL